MEYLWPCNVQVDLMAIQFTCLQVAFNSNMACSTAKRTEMWDSGTLVQHILGIFGTRVSIYSVHLLTSLSDQGHFAHQMWKNRISYLSYIAVTHSSNLVLSSKWPSRAQMPLLFYMLWATCMMGTVNWYRGVLCGLGLGLLTFSQPLGWIADT